MIRLLFGLLLSLSGAMATAQVSTKYTISFEKASQHQAEVTAEFTNLKNQEAIFRMSRSSPGRYALHEFAKNVYNVKATDSKGNVLAVDRQDPSTWKVKGHDGGLIVSYTLFANHGDGTYAQIDDTHAHLNMPAVFMYAPELDGQEIEIDFELPKERSWKIATQLKPLSDQRYYASNFQYFMDSPVEIADFRVRSFKVGDQSIELVLHDDEATEANIDTYMIAIKAIVEAQKDVFGELPRFEYGSFKFLACYMPNASRDGMEHRNSTVVTSTYSLAHGGIENNISTIAHEFFHCWNVERLRPKSLEPFNYAEANMSGELWFSEGFTSYFDDLSLVRGGVISKEAYLEGLNRAFNYVWTSPWREFSSPIDMSYQAPFVDAAKSVDETNRENTFVSYYSYGSMLGLGLDLSLRTHGLNLDDYMKLVWKRYGETEIPYVISDLQEILKAYAGVDFANHFFDHYVYKGDMPDFENLFEQHGIQLKTNRTKSFGAVVRDQLVLTNPKLESSAYLAGVQKGDKILQIGASPLGSGQDINTLLSVHPVGSQVNVRLERYGKPMEFKITVTEDIHYSMTFVNEGSKKSMSKVAKKQKDWLKR